MGAGDDLDDELDEVGEGVSGPDMGVPGVSPDLEALLREKGLKSPADLTNFVKNLEKRNTELGQEVRTMRVATMFPPPSAGPAPARTERKTLQIPEDPSELFTDRDKFKTFIGQADEVSRANARADFEEENAKREYARLYQQAVVKATENPEEFERLRQRMVRLSQTPGWANEGLDRIYSKAKEEELEDKKRQLEEIKSSLFGDVDLDQLRAVLGKTRTGQISTAGGAGSPRMGLPASREEAEKDIRDRILGAKLGS
jgi:hypothetical protein